jgi:type IV pilus assembly protein PilE
MPGARVGCSCSVTREGLPVEKWSSNRKARYPGQGGLTLIELMVVVAVLAILATIVIPTYDRYVRSARRADGKAALTAVALAQERAFSTYQKYVPLASLEDMAGLDHDLAALGKSSKEKYTVSLETQTGSAFTALAKPNSEDPDCGDLRLTSTGEKKASGPKGAAYCW